MIALDLFAGTGWGVACQRLGIEEHGVEIMPEAIVTRAANGMATIYGDVWEGLEGRHAVPDYDVLIASPPCQTFSVAGSGNGRRALDEVVELIDARAYADVAALRAFGETHDPRTALVLAPLAHVARDAPLFVVFEQVPPVLPVWKRCAEEMEKWGYSTWVGVLSSEQYGVPQTRKRAVLIARADGVDAMPPTPTHSRYYSHDRTRLDADVLPWISMAEALGWSSPDKVMRSNYGTGGDAAMRGEREVSDPSLTVTSKADRNKWVDRPETTFVSNDRQANSARRPATEPSPTITAGHDSANRVWTNQGNPRDGYYGKSVDAPSPVVTGVGSRSWHVSPSDPRIVKLDPSLPATTVAADPRLSSRSHHNHGEQSSTSTRVTLAEASALQSYPDGFNWKPTMPSGKPMAQGKAFLQVGNAVPPLLAEAILKTLLTSEDQGSAS